MTSGAGKRGKQGKQTGTIPDAIVESTQTGLVAIEIELSPKKSADLIEKITQLVQARTLNITTHQQKATFPVIWFYVPNEGLKKLIEIACSGLPEQDRRQVSVAIQKDLIG